MGGRCLQRPLLWAVAEKPASLPKINIKICATLKNLNIYTLTLFTIIFYYIDTNSSFFFLSFFHFSLSLIQNLRGATAGFCILWAAFWKAAHLAFYRVRAIMVKNTQLGGKL
jgi:hypothetical protein